MSLAKKRGAEGWPLVSRFSELADGTPNAVKAARSVWSGGKAGDTSKAYLSLFYIDLETFSSVDLAPRRELSLLRVG